MSTNDDNEPAFPNLVQCGMTLRDWFAGQALQGMMSGICCGHQINQPGEPIKIDESISKTAYAAADQMLEARKS